MKTNGKEAESGRDEKKKYLPYAGGKVTLAMAILGITAGLTITASAAGNEQNKGNNNGKTTVRLGVTKEAPKNVSFEVPLYYTAAIVKTNPDENNGRSNMVVHPEGYHITNTSLDNDPTKDNPKELVVAKVEVASVRGASWDLVNALDGMESATDKKMAVSIGGLPLPEVKAGDTTLKSAKLKDQTSVFYKRNNDGTGEYQILGDQNGDHLHDKDGRTDLDIVFDIPAAYAPKGDSATVAQFQVVYSLTTLDENGNPRGIYDQEWVDKDYLGPDKAKAETSAADGN